MENNVKKVVADIEVAQVQDTSLSGMLNTVIQGDCLEVMRSMPDKCVDLVVTSPPYDEARDYDGYTFDFKETAKELFRIIKDGGVVVWVIADQTKDFCESQSSFEQSLYFVDQVGFHLLDTMIFLKKDYPPAYPTLMRYANQFEYMFVFSKGKPNTFNPIQINKLGLGEGKKAYRQKDGSLIKKNIKDNGKKTKNASNVWVFQVGGGNGTGHPAVFPIKLAQNHILSWSNPTDIILDPFAGSGTTLVAAKQLGRKYIGIEISEKYCEIAKGRLLQETLF